MTGIEQILRERIGLDPVSIGISSIHRAIRLRMKAAGVGSAEDYAKRLQKSQGEWTELLESVVVTETWFFRDREPFDATIQFVKGRLADDAARRPVRILSVPCASGEEPYSLVMGLLDTGVESKDFEVDAADVSPRTLLKAKRAIYNKNSFRGKNLGFRDRYFHENKEGYVLCPAVRSLVRFFEANILKPDFLATRGHYDVIFCRNLLIYFDTQTQARALRAVSRLLNPDGLLVVGAAEQQLAFESGFTSANIPLAFACLKTGATPSRPVHEPHPVRRLTLPPVPRTGGTPRAAIGPGQKGPLVREGASGPASETPAALNRPAAALKDASCGEINSALPLTAADLTDAQTLANAGKFGDAAEMCERYLRHDATSAEAWYLLGLIRDATADPMAVECYRKALYLNPRHYETLMQMALLSEKSGDLARARTYRRRAARTKSAISPEATGA
jgi:chemotaxis protein methyltransferase WspC